MASKSGQRGISIVGFLFVSAVLVTVAMVGFRVMPAIIEYYSVQRALAESLQDIRDPASSIADVRAAFGRRADAGYIESVRASDLEITRDKNQVVARVEWTRRLHLVANASLLLEFEASASR
jgi:hypothetical protein